MTMSTQLRWIAVDWGTSTLRAWAIDKKGAVIAEATTTDGMSKVAPSAFEDTLLNAIGSWLPAEPNPPIPVIACGMVGARQGWKEAVYAQVPCKPVCLPFTVPNVLDRRIDVYIIPGLSQSLPPDVMRGEETQIAGLLHEQPNFEGTLCLPGTHTKWVRVKDGQIVEFQSFMTGELFDLISAQSVLRHNLGGDGWSDAAFIAGVELGLRDASSFPSHLFALRAESLLADLKPNAARARLSGLFIGLELAATHRFWKNEVVTIIGSKVANAYTSALTGLDRAPLLADPSAITLAGLHAAFKTHQLRATTGAD